MIVKKSINHVFLQLLVLLVFDQSSVPVYPQSLLVSICIVFNIWENENMDNPSCGAKILLQWNPTGNERFLSTSTN